MTLTVTVTREDIDAGEPRKTERCPVARALRRAGFRTAAVMCFTAHFGNCGPSATLPAEAVEFVRRFDRNEPVEPLTFALEV